MQTYEPLADVLGVSKSEREEIRPDPKKGSIWHSTVQNSRKALVDKGLLLPFVQSERGMWTLTEKGRKAAEALVKQGLPFLAALRRRLGHAGTAP
jgi:predicted transcriptional regulator